MNTTALKPLLVDRNMKMQRVIIGLLILLFSLLSPMKGHAASQEFKNLLGGAIYEFKQDYGQENLEGCELQVRNDAINAIDNYINEEIFKGVLLEPLKKSLRLLGALSGSGTGILIGDAIIATYNSNANATSFKNYLGLVAREYAAMAIKKGIAKLTSKAIGSQATVIGNTTGVIDSETITDVFYSQFKTKESHIKAIHQILFGKEYNESLPVKKYFTIDGNCNTEISQAWWDKKARKIHIRINSECNCNKISGPTYDFTPIKNGHLSLTADVKLVRDGDSLKFITSLSKARISGKCCGDDDGFRFTLLDTEKNNNDSPNTSDDGSSDDESNNDGTNTEKQKKIVPLCNREYTQQTNKTDQAYEKERRRIEEDYAKNMARLNEIRRNKNVAYLKLKSKVSQAKRVINSERDPITSNCDSLSDRHTRKQQQTIEGIQVIQRLESSRANCLRANGADCSYIDARISQQRKEIERLKQESSELDQQRKDCQTGYKKLKAQLPLLEKDFNKAQQELDQIDSRIRQLKNEKKRALGRLSAQLAHQQERLSEQKENCNKTGEWKTEPEDIVETGGYDTGNDVVNTPEDTSKDKPENKNEADTFSVTTQGVNALLKTACPECKSKSEELKKSYRAYEKIILDIKSRFGSVNKFNHKYEDINKKWYQISMDYLDDDSISGKILSIKISIQNDKEIIKITKKTIADLQSQSSPLDTTELASLELNINSLPKEINELKEDQVKLAKMQRELQQVKGNYNAMSADKRNKLKALFDQLSSLRLAQTDTMLKLSIASYDLKACIAEYCDNADEYVDRSSPQDLHIDNPSLLTDLPTDKCPDCGIEVTQVISRGGNNPYNPTDPIGGGDTTGRTLTKGGTETTDTTPPTVTPPAAIIVAAENKNGVPVSNNAIANFLASAIATDNIAVVGSISNNAPTGFFPVLPNGPAGITSTVTFTAMDAAGNTGSASSTVTVMDQTAPVLTLPTSIVLTATTGNTSILATDPTIATFLSSAQAFDNVDETLEVSSTGVPLAFPVGITNVSFSANDAAGNNSSEIRTVTVNAAPITGCSAGPVTLSPTGNTDFSGNPTFFNVNFGYDGSANTCSLGSSFANFVFEVQHSTSGSDQQIYLVSISNNWLFTTTSAGTISSNGANSIIGPIATGIPALITVKAIASGQIFTLSASFTAGNPPSVSIQDFK